MRSQAPPDPGRSDRRIFRSSRRIEVPGAYCMGRAEDTPSGPAGLCPPAPRGTGLSVARARIAWYDMNLDRMGPVSVRAVLLERNSPANGTSGRNESSN